MSVIFYWSNLVFKWNWSLSFEIWRDRVLDRKQLLEHYGKVDQSSWGIADEYLLDFAASHLEQHKDIPQFYSLLTISSHHPWNVPKSYLTYF
ncbi:hypothetical protein [Candidatus Neptunichlamydia sp. REUL1]|uniref:hypothetical protein n=1 Tax=Candidatus Neptunichlamydia sp. REUL1 TaxID=3064277 RepID=UPI00292F0960|nr:hypothetical protein [Candidatus Neptunochlamydia sp. REUL1]